MNSSHLPLLLLALVVGSRLLPSAWTSRMTVSATSLEAWVGHSWARIYGLPALTALTIVGLAEGSGYGDGTRQFLAMAFVSFILLAFFARVSGMKQVRLGISLAFFTVFFSAGLSIAVLMLRG
jgi:hypothetical protein